MPAYLSFESREHPRMTEAQRRLAFESIKHRGRPVEDLPDFHRIVRRIEGKIAKAKTLTSKFRYLDHAITNLELIRREAIAKFRSLEGIGAIDEPESFWLYIESLDIAKATMLHNAESLSLETEDQPIKMDEPTAICSYEAMKPTTIVGADVMDVAEVSAYLKVSKSTIYHLSASGGIPVARIGTRLTFLKAEIDTWLVASA